jgi:hypothetical protein
MFWYNISIFFEFLKPSFGKVYEPGLLRVYMVSPPGDCSTAAICPHPRFYAPGERN